MMLHSSECWPSESLSRNIPSEIVVMGASLKKNYSPKYHNEVPFKLINISPFCINKGGVSGHFNNSEITDI